MSFSAYRNSLLRSIAAVAVLGLSGLSGCTQVYDDTKGWANDVEAWARKDILESVSPSAQQVTGLENGRSAADKSPTSPTALATTSAMAAAPVPVPSAPGVAASNADDQMHTSSHAAELYPQTAGKPAVGISDSKEKLTSAPAQVAEKTQLATADPAVATSVSGLRLHLSSNGSKKAAEQEWNQLVVAFPTQLKGLEPQIERADLGKKGVFFRVLAGPLQDESTARKICSRLKEKRQYCALVPDARSAPLPAGATHAKG